MKWIKLYLSELNGSKQNQIEQGQTGPNYAIFSYHIKRYVSNDHTYNKLSGSKHEYEAIIFQGTF